MKKKGYNILAILAIISVSLFILGFVLDAFFGFNELIFFPLLTLGLIFGIVALNQIKKTGQKGKGLAIAAIAIVGIFFLWMMIRLMTTRLE